jgi:hypothetical protein
MKSLITIILITIATSATAQSNTTRIAELEKFRTWSKAQFAWLLKEKTIDSLRIVKLEATIKTDTTSQFKIASRVAVVEDKLLDFYEMLHTIDSVVSWKMAQVQSQDWTTMRKDVGYLADEINMLIDSLTAISKRIPPIFKTKVSGGLLLTKDTTLIIDPVLKAKLDKLP